MKHKCGRQRSRWLAANARARELVRFINCTPSRVCVCIRYQDAGGATVAYKVTTRTTTRSVARNMAGIYSSWCFFLSSFFALVCCLHWAALLLFVSLLARLLFICVPPFIAARSQATNHMCLGRL